MLYNIKTVLNKFVALKRLMKDVGQRWGATLTIVSSNEVHHFF